MPHLLLFNTLSILREVVHKVLDLLDLSLSICVNNLCQVLHETEVSTHSICQTS